MTDKEYINQTFELAKKAGNHTFPNPLVGAVIVKNNKVIGEGFHKIFGGNHAEIEAINSARNVAGATLYVNLAPCHSSGKTPPCTEAIIKSGIKKVVYAASDPSHIKTDEILTSAGIEVMSGICEEEGKKLNEAFFYFNKFKQPFTAIKFAVSLDGKLATKTNDSKWITSAESREYARSLRGQYQAILVGANTVINDDPNLGANGDNCKDPLRIILDGSLKTNPEAQVYRDENVIVFCGQNAKEDKINDFKNKNVEVIQLITEKIYLRKVLEILASRQIINIFVEGGGKVIGSFIDEKLVHKVYGFYAPILLGGEGAVSISGEGAAKVVDGLKLKNINTQIIGGDILITADTI